MTATADLTHMQDLVGIKILGDKKEYKLIRIDYNPDRFKGAIIRFKNLKGTVLVFESGKIVCVGARREDMAKEAFEKCAEIIRELGFKAKVRNFEVHNFVASWDMGARINIREFAIANKQFCSYEPEIFPGCIYELNKSKILIFLSGKVFTTGVRDKADIKNIFQHIVLKLKDFLKPSSPCIL